jgi:hypothetical protein
VQDQHHLYRLRDPQKVRRERQLWFKNGQWTLLPKVKGIIRVKCKEEHVISSPDSIASFFPQDEGDNEDLATSDAADCQVRGVQPPTDLDMKLGVVLGLAARLLRRWVWQKVITALLYVVACVLWPVLWCIFCLGSNISYWFTLLDSEFIACAR